MRERADKGVLFHVSVCMYCYMSASVTVKESVPVHDKLATKKHPSSFTDLYGGVHFLCFSLCGCVYFCELS